MFFYRGVFWENGGTAVCGLQIYAFFVSDKCGLGMKKSFVPRYFRNKRFQLKKQYVRNGLFVFRTQLTHGCSGTPHFAVVQCL